MNSPQGPDMYYSKVMRGQHGPKRPDSLHTHFQFLIDSIIVDADKHACRILKLENQNISINQIYLILIHQLSVKVLSHPGHFKAEGSFSSEEGKTSPRSQKQVQLP